MSTEHWTIPTWVSLLADIASVGGLIISSWVLFETKRLKRTFTLRARTPEIRKALDKIARGIQDDLSSSPSSSPTKRDLISKLARTRAILENLKYKLPASQRGDISQLISELKGKRRSIFWRHPLTAYEEHDLWQIHQKIQWTVTTLEQREKDFPWE